MDVTVIICTRNRAASLARTLDSLVQLREPSAAWEVLVVDNGSTDETAATIREYAGRLPLRGCHEPRAGLSVARNRGVTEATGGHLDLDDDVIVDPEWLCAYVDAFRRWPDAAFFGGQSQAVLEGPSTAWFDAGRRHLGDLLAIRDLGRTGQLMDRDRLPFGLNFAVRADLQRHYAYDIDLGVAPGRRRGGEEVDLFRRMLDDGLEGRWVAEARVSHMIPSERQSESYVRQDYHAAGEDFVWRTFADGRAPATVVLGSMLRAVLFWPAAKLAPWAPFGVRAMVRQAYHAGILAARQGERSLQALMAAALAPAAAHPVWLAVREVVR